MIAEHHPEQLDIDRLLGQPTPQAQADFLRAEDCFNPSGLDDLLSQAAHLMGTDPGKASAIAAVCESLAHEVDADALIPGATYLRARAHAINAEFDLALDLIEGARIGYIVVGERLEAVRTNVGRMFVLQEQGRYAEALETAEAVRDYLRQAGTLDPAHAPGEANALAARVSQNQGLCFELIGSYNQALTAYTDAEARFSHLGMTESLAEVKNNRGIVLLRLGRGREALDVFERALPAYKEANLTLKVAQTLNNIGNARLLLGDYSLGLAAFEQAGQILEPLAAQSDKHIVLLDLAEAYLSLNLYDEALPTYREATRALNASSMHHDLARAEWGMGAALMATGKLDEATQVLASSATLFAAAGNAPMQAIVALKQSDLCRVLGQREGALRFARQALKRVDSGPWALQQAYAHLSLADALIPDIEQARAHLQACEVLMQQVDLPSLRYLLNQRLGHVHLIAGNALEAERRLRAAIGEVEQLRANVSEDRLRVSFAADKLAAYDDLVRLYLARQDTDDAAHAFAMAERAKARALVTLLNATMGAPLRAPRVPGQAEDSHHTEQRATHAALYAELNATYNRLLGRGEDSPSENRRSQAELQERALELEREIGRLQLHARARDAAPSDLSEPMLDQPLTLEAICAELAPSTALVSYYVLDNAIIAFVVTRDGVQAVGQLPDGIASVSAIAPLLQRLGAQWERFRAGRAFAKRHTLQLEQSTQRVLALLYDAVFKPLEPYISQQRELIIVPHGLLHQVPFHALFNGAGYLIERYTMSYAPSATVQTICQQRTSPNTGRAVVVAVADALIPAVVAEAHAVAQLISSTTLLIGDEATVSTVRKQVAGSEVVHLACHGLFRAGNPMFSSLKLHDGWLLALDALALDLRGALVTLSACESGRSQTLEGDEIMGLVRAFLGAGAATLVVSLWLVQDETTAELMRTWYDHIRRGMGRAEALRAAQLALKSKFAHPYYWAPFMIIGQR